MRHPRSIFRAVVALLLLVGLVAASGCSWFRKSNELYAPTAQSRPLEVPPDLDLPRTDGAVTAPALASAATPVQASQAAAAGFTVTGSRDEVFAKVDAALATIDGVTVASRAKLLGVIDVNYQGNNFLVRISAVEAGAYVSAVDPRGLPATGEGPTQLIAALRSAIGGN